jgi:hypothetical protein
MERYTDIKIKIRMKKEQYEVEQMIAASPRLYGTECCVKENRKI